MTIKDFKAMYALWEETGLSLLEIKAEKKLAKQIIELSPDTNFVAEKNGQIIGTIFGAFNGRRGWIYHLAVHPYFQNKGLGSKLLSKAEKALKKEGVERILLGVSKKNLKVMPFYKKLGYLKADDAIYLGKNI